MKIWNDNNNKDGNRPGSVTVRLYANGVEDDSAVLSAAGADLSRVVKTTCFLSDIADFAAFNEAYGKYFPQKPARSVAGAAALPKGALVEIEAVAEIGK